MTPCVLTDTSKEVSDSKLIAGSSDTILPRMFPQQRRLQIVLNDSRSILM